MGHDERLSGTRGQSDGAVQVRRILTVCAVTVVLLAGTAGVASAAEPAPQPAPVHCYPLSLFCSTQFGPFQFDIPINFKSLFPAQP